MRQATQKRAESEAAAWFTRLSHVSVTTDTLYAFREWKRNKDNAAAYAAVEATWDRAKGLGGDPDIRARTAELLERPSRVSDRRIRVIPAALALGGAGVASVAAAVTWLALSQPVYRTGVGEQRLIVLADGSRVRLNTDSAIRVRLGGKARRVELARGEAFFEVRHDPQRPFTVVADGARITDFGTSFDVRRTLTAVKVTLMEGQVRVSGRQRGQVETLAPNQQLVVTERGVSAPSPIDAAATSSWTSGRLVFHATPLDQAVAEVNRYARTKVVIDGPPQLADQPVSGVFDVGDTPAFVAAVRTLFSLQARTDPDGSIHLARPNPSA